MRWAIIAVVAAFLSVGLIGLFIFALLLPSTAPSPAAVAVATPAPPGLLPPAPPSVEDKEVDPLQGTWIATAVTINGEAATDDDVAKVKLTMDLTGFKLVLPTTEKKGASWTIKADLKPNLKGNLDITTNKIDFLVNDGSTLEAIYEINGDAMKLCLSQDGGPRPTDFASKKDSQRTLVVLKRKEP